MKLANISTKAFFAIATIAVFAGFFFRSISTSLDPQISLKNARLAVEIYRSGQPARKGELSADSSGVAAINSLFEKQRGRWRRSWTSYAPAVVVQSDNFRLNLHKNLLILNYRRNTNPDTHNQVVSNITKEEFDHASKSILESLVEATPETGQR